MVRKFFPAHTVLWRPLLKLKRASPSRLSIPSQLTPHLSSSCLVAHKAFTEFLHLSRLTTMVFTSFQDCHPASALSFSTVRLQVVFGLPLLLFPSGALSSYLPMLPLTSVQCTCSWCFLGVSEAYSARWRPVGFGFRPSYSHSCWEDRPQSSLDKVNFLYFWFL